MPRMPKAPGPAVLVKSAPGRLGNQAVPIAAVYAYALHTGRPFINLTFQRYIDHFPNLRAHTPTGSSLKVAQRIASIRQKLPLGATAIRTTSAGDITDQPKPFLHLPPTAPDLPGAGRGPVYFRGWRLFNAVGFDRYRAEIRTLMAPKPEVRESVDRFAAAWPTGRLVVAVHVRMTDFRDYRGGDMLIPIDGYRAAIEALSAKLADRDPFFVIFSDEPDARDGLTDRDHIVSDGDAIEDVFRMARCHLIVGAASSFNMFAAIYGGARALHLHPHLSRGTKTDLAPSPVIDDTEEAVAWARTVDVGAPTVLW